MILRRFSIQFALGVPTKDFSHVVDVLEISARLLFPRSQTGQSRLAYTLANCLRRLRRNTSLQPARFSLIESDPLEVSLRARSMATNTQVRHLRGCRTWGDGTANDVVEHMSTRIDLPPHKATITGRLRRPVDQSI